MSMITVNGAVLSITSQGHWPVILRSFVHIPGASVKGLRHRDKVNITMIGSFRGTYVPATALFFVLHLYSSVACSADIIDVGKGFEMYTYDWNEYSEGSNKAISSLALDKGKRTVAIYTASAGYSDIGKKKMYFSLEYVVQAEQSEMCDATDSKYPISSIWNFKSVVSKNTQAVKMLIVCKEFGHKGSYLSASAATKSGEDYVVRLFKKSAANIRITTPKYTLNLSDDFYISPMGFIAAWNSGSKDAL